MKQRIFYLYYQGPRTGNTQHVKNIKDMVDIVGYRGGSITEDKALIEHERKLKKTTFFVRDLLREH